jgi:hypothetical protein
MIIAFMPSWLIAVKESVKRQVCLTMSHYTFLVDSRKSLLAEVSNTLLRSIAQHSQVELTVEPTAEPTIKTTVNIHRYTIRADCNQFDNDVNGYTIQANRNCRHHAHPSVYRPPHHLCRLEGCYNPLIALWLITAIAILFFAIHTVARAYSDVELRF